MAERRRVLARLATVRARTTLAATALVGLAVLVGAVALVIELRRSMVEHVDDVAEVRADDVAALGRAGALPATLPVAGDDGALVQVVRDGRVIAASPGLPDDRPVVDFEPAGAEPEIRTVSDLDVGDAESFRVLARTTTTADGEVTIYVVASLEPADEATAQLRQALVFGLPLLLGLVGLAAWYVVGRALRPIDDIRAQVDEISERSLGTRVPVPSTDDEVGRLAVTMNQMLERIESGVERQRRFVADASHELQTPLAALRADLEVALAHPSDAEWQTTGRDVLAASARMERLVRDLLYLARADSGAPAVSMRPVGLDDIVAEEVTRLRQHARITVDTSRVSAATVLGRPDDLGRAVRNLLDNAARYAASSVHVLLDANGDGVVLEVADDGPGVPDDQREHIFERFGRLDDARDRTSGGTGLGLAITREIVEAHGGRITVEQANGQLRGARFVVRLPSV